MKNIIAVILLIGIAACSAPQGDSLEDKKALLAEKKTALRAIEKEIETLKAEINELDPPKEKPAVVVESAKVEKSNFERYVEVQGKVEADEFVNISSEIGGRLVKVYVKEGQYVKKGQLIATTDISTLEKQIEEIKTQLSLATTVYERQKRLWEQNIGSEIQYLEAKTGKEGLEKSLATLNSQVVKKNVYSPISGYVDREFMKSGETSSPGMPIVQILNTSNVKITADVQENFLKSISKGDSVQVAFPALGISINETIDQIGRTIDLNNRTFEIEIQTNSQKGKLKPNLLSVLKFKDYEQNDIISIPLDVIQEEVNGRKFVYLIKDEDGKQIARKSYINIGESNTSEVIVESGIVQGDELITMGAKSVSDGDFIKSNS